MSDRCRQCEETSAVLQEWIDKQGHDRCWYYPDLFKKLIGILKIQSRVEPQLPPRKEFEAGCRRYQDEEFSSR